MYYPAIELCGKLVRKCQKLGYKIEYSNDFTRINEHAKHIGYEATPHFDPEKSDMVKTQSFWLGAYYDGECVGMVCCKRQMIAGESLDQFINRTWRRYYAGYANDQFSMKTLQPRLVKDITGNLIYNGEFRVAKQHRNKGIGFALWNIARITSFTQWQDTDWSYIIVKEQDYRSGLIAISQMSRQVENCFLWETPPTQEATGYALGLMDQQGYQDWVDLMIRQKAWSNKKS